MRSFYGFKLESLRCCFTTKALGSLTFARSNPQEVLENYRSLEDVSGISPERIVRPSLANGTKLVRVGEEDAGRGVTRPLEHLKGIDALYTNAPNLYIAITTADCFALVLYDRVNQAVGIAHCGWRGIVGRLDEKVFRAMERDFGTRPKDVTAVIGPGIRSCCYVQHDDGLRDAFRDYALPLIKENSDGTYNIDIALALKANLDVLGITEIVDTQLCTGCNDEFYSARLEGFETGRMLNLASLLEVGC